MSGFPRFVGHAIDGVLSKLFTLPQFLEVIADSLDACLSGHPLSWGGELRQKHQEASA